MKTVSILAALILTLAACSTAPRTRVTISKDEARVETRGEVAKPATITKDATGKVTITTPTTPEPPAPETSADKARTRAQIIYRLAFVLGIAACAFGFSKGWEFVGIGGACVALGSLCGIGLATVSPAIIAAVIIGGVCIALTGAACWFFKVRKRDSAPVTMPGPVTPAESQP